jgi:hypothetical protein
MAPEAALAAAVLRQIRADMHSRHPNIRKEAQTFLADPANIGFWADALGLDQSVLVQGLRAARRERH